MWTKQYWKDLAERVVAGAGTGFVLALGGDVANFSAGKAEVYLAAVLGGALFSLAKGLAARGVGDKQSAALLTDRQ